MKPERDDPKLAEAFAKDPASEDFLARLNGRLAADEERDYRSDLEERFPTVHVIGAPRSGTTLMTQLIAAHLGLGWVSNLAAAFWAAPCTGLRLQRHFFGEHLHSDYSSVFGRTRLMEPHEFGYFWTRLLGHGPEEPADSEGVDWRRLKRVLLNMSETRGGPMVFKSFQLAWHLERVLEELPRTCFVYMSREPVENVLSILRLRRGLSGDEREWVSVKPRGWEELRKQTPLHQAAGQLLLTRRALDARVAAVQGRNVLRVGYEELCTSPRVVLERVAELLRRNGAEVALDDEVPERFDVHSEEADMSRILEVRRVLEGFTASENP